jgi:hypothetical protein
VDHNRFEQAIAALLKHKTIGEAAAELGVNEKTVREWMKQPAFQELYREVRGEILERTVAQLLAVCAEAVEALKRNLTCGRPAPENRAAVAILDQAVKGAETLDLAEAVAELRKQVEEMKRGDRGAETRDPATAPEHQPTAPGADRGGTDPVG